MVNLSLGFNISVGYLLRVGNNVFSDSEDSTTTVNVQRAVSEEPWNTVKFSFEIEEVSAAVYWKEAGPVRRDVLISLEPLNCTKFSAFLQYSY